METKKGKAELKRHGYSAFLCCLIHFSLGSAAYGRDRMKELLSLSVLYITLALCQAGCFYMEPKRVIRNGVLVTQEDCTDPFDGNKYPPGSEWNTAYCIRCSCRAGEMRCCARYGSTTVAPSGCITAVNPETCQYEFYHVDNALEPC